MAISALRTALAGYTARTEAFAKIAERVARKPVDTDIVKDTVGMITNQRAAEANLAVARVAQDMDETAIHVIA
jgi:hypothetical protein